MTEGLEQDAISSSAPVLAADPVGPAWVEMYLHPRRFVTEFLPKVSLGLWRTLALLWLTGIASATNVSALQALTRHVSWGYYWGYASAIACLAGPMVVFASMIGFDLRLKFCGVSTRSGGVFRVVLASSTASRLPILIGALMKSVAYASPLAALADVRILWIQLAAVAALPLEYFAAREIFGAPRGRALFWFMFVPIIVVAVAAIYPMIRR